MNEHERQRALLVAKVNLCRNAYNAAVARGDTKWRDFFHRRWNEWVDRLIAHDLEMLKFNRRIPKGVSFDR